MYQKSNSDATKKRIVFTENRNAHVVGASPPGSLLERLTWLKHNDPEYRRKNLPESALTPAERHRLKALQRAEREAGRAGLREWERRFPIGCGLDGIDYSGQWRVLRLYLPPGHKPSMSRTIRFALAHWPQCRRIVCASGKDPCINYVRKGPRAWTAVRPENAEYVH